MTSLTEKLLNAQKGLKAPKGQYNSFGKYKYRSAEDILEAVKPINADNGLLLTITDEPILIGDWHYIKAAATITDGTDTHVVNAYARESPTKKGMDDSQITGTASSYARKYALNGLYLIDDTKDADTDEYGSLSSSKEKPEQPKQDEISQKQVGLIKVKAMEFAKLRNRKADEVYAKLSISDVTKLTKDQASKAIKTLESWISGAKGGNNADTKTKS